MNRSGNRNGIATQLLSHYQVIPVPCLGGPTAIHLGTFVLVVDTGDAEANAVRALEVLPTTTR